MGRFYNYTPTLIHSGVGSIIARGAEVVANLTVEGARTVAGMGMETARNIAGIRTEGARTIAGMGMETARNIGGYITEGARTIAGINMDTARNVSGITTEGARSVAGITMEGARNVSDITMRGAQNVAGIYTDTGRNVANITMSGAELQTRTLLEGAKMRQEYNMFQQRLAEDKRQHAEEMAYKYASLNRSSDGGGGDSINLGSGDGGWPSFPDFPSVRKGLDGTGFVVPDTDTYSPYPSDLSWYNPPSQSDNIQTAPPAADDTGDWTWGPAPDDPGLGEAAQDIGVDNISIS